jgi:hypothetical protein
MKPFMISHWNMRWLKLFVALLTIGHGFESKAIATPPLRFAKPIEFEPITQEELIACTLDSGVFATTRDGNPDLRILGADDQEVAFLLRMASITRTDTVRKTWISQPPAVKMLKENGLEITLQLQEIDPQPSGLRLITPLRDFERKIRVEASTDGETWHPVVESGLLFDYSQVIDVRNDLLNLPADKLGDNPRHFRITVDDLTEEQESQLLELTRRLTGDEETNRSERVTIRRQPFRIDRIEFWSESARQSVRGPRDTDYPVEFSPQDQVEEKSRSQLMITTHRHPISSLTLVTTDRNFSRTAQVEVERDNGRETVWQPLGSSTISRMDFRALQREQLRITFPQTRSERLRLVIENRDSSPLSITKITAAGPAYEAIFLAEPSESYRLAYGSNSLEAPQYDLAALSESLSADYRTVAAKLGKPIELSPAEAEPATLKLFNNPVFLIGVIAILAFLLGIGLYRASKRINDLGEESNG